MHLARVRFALVLGLLVACGSSTSDPPKDGGAHADANAQADAGADAQADAAAQADAEADAEADAVADAESDAADADTDPADILGTLSGTCGTLKSLLASPDSSLVENHLDFVAGETYGPTSLSAGGDRIFATPNAGGSSVESEVMSFEVLHYCEGATLLKTETEIGYAPPDDAGASSITDILVTIDGKRVGVSVTRAYKPPSIPLTDADVKALLLKKLEGINRSSVRVLPADKWVKQILHVLSVSQAATESIERMLPTIDAAIRADTIVLVTQTSGGGFLYCNPDPPLGSECQ
jgi:hypothetical protein